MTIPLYPASDKERKARNLAAVTSFVSGDVPFLRTLGLPINIDSTMNTRAMRSAITAAVVKASESVHDCEVGEVQLSFDASGHAIYTCEVK